MLVHYVTPTQPAGSADGLTMYKYGPSYAVRSRAYPVRVRSNAHTSVMSTIADLSMQWEIALGGSERLAWGNYAYNSPLTTAYGMPRYIRGYAHYMRSNRPRLQHGLPRIDAGPTTYGYPAYTLPKYVMSSDNATVLVATHPDDEWANQDGAYMLLWQSWPISPARTRPPEVYRPLGVIAGSSTTPPASPASFACPTPLPAGPVRQWIRSSVTLADGRLTGA